jgi:hypothetical protein
MLVGKIITHTTLDRLKTYTNLPAVFSEACLPTMGHTSVVRPLCKTMSARLSGNSASFIHKPNLPPKRWS